MVAHAGDSVRRLRSGYEREFGFHVPENYVFKSGRGVSHELVDALSSWKEEPDWMRRFRHESLDGYLARPLPRWRPDLSGLALDELRPRTARRDRAPRLLCPTSAKI